MLAKYISGGHDDLLALGKEGGDNDCSSSTHVFAAEVCFDHVGLHGDDLLIAKGDGL